VTDGAASTGPTLLPRCSSCNLLLSFCSDYSATQTLLANLFAFSPRLLSSHSLLALSHTHSLLSAESCTTSPFTGRTKALDGEYFHAITIPSTMTEFGERFASLTFVGVDSRVKCAYPKENASSQYHIATTFLNTETTVFPMYPFVFSDDVPACCEYRPACACIPKMQNLLLSTSART